MSLLRGIVLVLPLLLLFSTLFGMTGVWLAMPESEIVVSLLGVKLLTAKKKER